MRNFIHTKLFASIILLLIGFSFRLQPIVKSGFTNQLNRQVAIALGADSQNFISHLNCSYKIPTNGSDYVSSFQYIYGSRTYVRTRFYLGDYQLASNSVPISDLIKKDQTTNYFLGLSRICLKDSVGAAHYWSDPSLAWLAFSSVWQLYHKDNPEIGDILYDLALLADPNISVGKRPTAQIPIIWVYTTASKIEEERGNIEQAINWLLIAKNENYPDEWILDASLAKLFLQTNNITEAIIYGEKAIYHPQSDFYIHLLYARIIGQSGQWPESIPKLSQWMQDPTNQRSLSDTEWDLFFQHLQTRPLYYSLNNTDCTYIRDALAICSDSGICQSYDKLKTPFFAWQQACDNGN